MCNMIILELISFFNHHLPSHLRVFAQGTPFQNENQKKVALKKGATRFRISPVTVSCRDRHVSIVPNLCSAGGGNGDLRQIQNKASVMKTWSNSFCMYNIQKYPWEGCMGIELV